MLIHKCGLKRQLASLRGDAAKRAPLSLCVFLDQSIMFAFSLCGSPAVWPGQGAPLGDQQGGSGAGGPLPAALGESDLSGTRGDLGARLGTGSATLRPVCVQLFWCMWGCSLQCYQASRLLKCLGEAVVVREAF